MLIVRVFFLYCVVASVQAWTALAEGPLKITAASLRGREDIVFFCDFESPTWYEQFGMTDNPPRGVAVSSDSALKFEP